MQKRPNLITVTGHPGAGKSTACKKLAEQMGWEYFYTGMVMRKIGDERGLSVGEITKLESTDKSIATQVDAVYKELNKSAESYVIDARLGWFFMPDSFKVMFNVPISIGAQRVIAEEKRFGDESFRDLDSAINIMQARREVNTTSYRNNYNIQNNEDYNHFDLVLDTAYSSPERNVSFVRAAFSLWQKGIRLPKIWLSPKSLYPTHDVMKMNDVVAQEQADHIREHGYDVLQPIFAVQIEDQVYIIDGHHRVSAAVRAQCDFVPIVLLDAASDMLRKKTPEAYVKSLISPELILDWERAHAFAFSMPSVLLKK